MAASKVGGARKRKRLLLVKLRRLKARRGIPVNKKEVIDPNCPYEEEPAVKEFRAWCSHVTIELHPKLYIGRQGSRHEIGIRARETILRGEVIAKLPRSSLLTANNCHLNHQIKNSKIISSSDNSWLPLLAALIGEYSLKGHSYWQPYLNLVPNNRDCPPPILWSDSEREALLGGTGLYHLVTRDLSRLENDYKTIVEPFLIDNCVDESVYSLEHFKQAAAFVMSYSFTDYQSESFLSHTMMIPFVDLLNHHTNHHVELIYKKNHLELVAIRKIPQGEEIMNTFGQLPNYSLLHTHGFIEMNNKVDKACIPLCYLQEKYLSFQFKTLTWRKNRWKQLADNDLFDEVYEVNTKGFPEKRLLKVIKTLLAERKDEITSLCHYAGNIDCLTNDERNLLYRYIKSCIDHIPDLSLVHSDWLIKEQKLYINYARQMCEMHGKYLVRLMQHISFR